MIPIVIPAYNPDDRLKLLVCELYRRGHIVIVVNDGSTLGVRVFDEIKDCCVLLAHERNRGKGAAIKTAILHTLDRYAGTEGCVCADADGQHLISDIELVMGHLRKNPTHLVLGTRSVTRNNPFRSWVGRILMQLSFWIVTRRWFSDTQTGLRGIPSLMYRSVLNLRGSRYEFESEMILLAHTLKIQIDETNIETVYWGNNDTSHFRTYVDFGRIVFSLFWGLLPVRYLSTSIVSFCLDNSVFALVFFFFSIFNELEMRFVIAVSVCVARVMSGHVHYILNGLIVFRTHLKFANYLKYVLLVSLIGFLSFELTHIGVILLDFKDWQVVVWKVVVEVCLLSLSYVAQRFVVFSGDGNRFLISKTNGAAKERQNFIVVKNDTKQKCEDQ